MQARPAPPTRQRGGFLASEPLLLVALVILTLYFARDLVAPMAFALVLNFLLSPAVALLERWREPFGVGCSGHPDFLHGTGGYGLGGGAAAGACR